METNKKRKVRFNLFDVLIVLLAAAIGFGVLKLRSRTAGENAGTTARVTAPMRFTVEFTYAPNGMAEQIHEGDDVYRSTDGAYIGKVAQVRAVPHAETDYVPELGRYVRYEAPELSDIYLTVEGDGSSTARDIIIGEVPIKLCGELAVKGRGFARVGYVYALDTQGAAIAPNNETGAGKREAVYVVRLDDMREALTENDVHVGDRVYEKISGALMGVVEETWVEPHKATKPDAAGGTVTAGREGYCYQYIKLRGRFVDKADGYYLDGGTELKVGAPVTVSSQYLDRQGIFYSLESVADAS